MKISKYKNTSDTLRDRLLFLLTLVACALSLSPLPLMFFGLWPMSISVPLLVSPAVLLLFGIALYTSRFKNSFFSQCYRIGFLGGLLATIAYDVSRITGLFWRFQGFNVIHKFGMLITGKDEFTFLTASLGWLYHFMNGGVFGITFALIWGKRANVAWGILWGILLEIGMLLTYPRYFSMDMGVNSAAFIFSMLGHCAYGAVLGYLVKRILNPKVIQS